MSPAGNFETTLQWTLPPWAMGAVAVAILLTVLFAWRRRSPLGRMPELLLLIPALAAVGFSALGPVQVVEGKRLEPARFAVLVDDSRSLQVKEDGVSRHVEASALVSKLQSLPEAEVFRFGGELQASNESTYRQGETDLGGALRAIGERYVGESLAGIALVTDGIDRSSLRDVYYELEELNVPSLPGPLTIYQVGGQKEVKDLAVVEVFSGGFAFLRSPFEVRARVVGRAYAGLKVPVRLHRDGRLVAEKSVLLDGDGAAEVTFSVTPKKVGRFSYELSVPDLQDDAVAGNNTMPVAIRVVRDRLRVLQVCGAPSLDQKFLRLFLKQDPSVDLVSFFILRTNQDMGAGYGPQELSLIAFPYERLFSEDLWTFDLVVLQNFDYEPYFGWRAAELLGNLADFVRRGGALVMIGGDRSFDKGDYAASPLADVLPVELGVVGEHVDTTAFRAELSSQGRLHPLTQLLSDNRDSEALWGRLAELDGLNLTRGLAPQSAALLVHPDLKTPSGASMPVLAVREVGMGRTMALMGDSSWRWVMAEAAAGHGNQAYLRFWKSAMRWLVHDPAGEPVQVETGQENHVVGETVRVRAQVRDVGFEPVVGAVVTGRIEGPDTVVPIDLISDAAGEIVVEVVAETLGTHRVYIEAANAGLKLGEASTVFAVTARDPELEEVTPDSQFLQALAGQVGGLYVPAGSFVEPLRDEEAGRWVSERTQRPLWAGLWIPLVAGLLGSVSWWVRRRGGGR